jgi:hypothetical protein
VLLLSAVQEVVYPGAEPRATGTGCLASHRRRRRRRRLYMLWEVGACDCEVGYDFELCFRVSFLLPSFPILTFPCIGSRALLHFFET